MFCVRALSTRRTPLTNMVLPEAMSAAVRLFTTLPDPDEGADPAPEVLRKRWEGSFRASWERVCKQHGLEWGVRASEEVYRLFCLLSAYPRPNDPVAKTQYGPLEPTEIRDWRSQVVRTELDRLETAASQARR